MLYSVLCLFHKEVILNNALTPSFATTYRQTRVYSVNCRNERGRRLRKDRILPAGVRLPVISSGTSTGVLMHGAPYYIVLDGDRNQLTLISGYFEMRLLRLVEESRRPWPSGGVLRPGN